MAHQMPNPIALYEETAKGFRTAMAAVKEAQMSSPTPCTEWNVRALLSHNIKVAEFVHGVFIGQITVNPMEVRGPLPKEGPLTAFDTGVSSVLDVAKVRGALDKQLSTPFGPMTGAQLLMVPFLDLLIHRWDLAKATGQNTRLEPHLVEVGLSMAPMIDGARKGGMFATAVPVSDKTSLQDKLIGLCGRRP
jgi:uncharacterized protein (TIGR03086 family)